MKNTDKWVVRLAICAIGAGFMGKCEVGLKAHDTPEIRAME